MSVQRKTPGPTIVPDQTVQPDATDVSTSLVALVFHRPPWLALGLALVAILLSQAPDPTNPDATGVSASVFALPMLSLAVVAALPTLLRVLSQKRALASGDWISARVSTVETLRSDAVLPRHRIMWTDPVGRAGRSLVIRKRWVPPKGTTIRVRQDPTNGRQWWEGDFPGIIPEAALMGTGASAGSTKGARLSGAWSRIGTWVAIFGGVFTVMLALSGAPSLLTSLPVIALLLGLRSTVLHHRAFDRALRFGKRLEAKVIRHHTAPISRISSLKNRRGAAMEWETRRGHFGETDYVAADRVIEIGKKITVCVDPVKAPHFGKTRKHQGKGDAG